jgi:hypothetical protein
MHKILLLAALSVLPFQFSRAGAPSVEILEALVHEVKETPTGFSLVVSGEVRIGSVKGLKADHAVLTQPHGNPAFVVEDRESYEKRLRSYVGKKITVQVWGDILTIESGRITRIHGGQVHPLYPTREESPNWYASRSSANSNSETSGTGQPASSPESDSKGGEKPQPGSE